jgi:tRNA (guanine10-N2)-dimethyltransferase
MTQSVCILGRQPALGVAELESLYGVEHVMLLAPQVAGLTVDSVDFTRLGGSTRLGLVLATLTTTDWKLIEKELQKIVRSAAFDVPTEGKFHLGLSAYGLGLSAPKLNASALTLKKIIRTRGVSVRVVPNNEAELSTAQVYHSHLADKNGAELLIIRTDDHKTLIARTTAIQDIDGYTMRDRGRPKRDARVGMLPPKLAQIIINLATADARPTPEHTLLDPFCGTGVVLQEAALMGYTTHGTDLEPRMITYTQANLEWLATKFDIPDSKSEVGDATSYTWQPQPSFVACETYLGRPFTDTPARGVIEQTVSEVNAILSKFLRNMHGQLAPGVRLCLAVPAWQIRPKQFRHLPLVDQISDLGYNRVEFERVSHAGLLYYREDQIVARQLLVLTRK